MIQPALFIQLGFQTDIFQHRLHLCRQLW